MDLQQFFAQSGLTPEQMKKKLSEVQALQTEIVFPVSVSHPNPGQHITFPVDEVTNMAEAKFKIKRPGYRVDLLCTTLLTERAIRELNKKCNDPPPITLENGCCNNSACPTTIFIHSVVEAINDLFAKDHPK